MIFLQRDASHAADVRFDGDEARILKDGVVVRDWTGGGVIAGLPQGSGYTLEVVKDGQLVTDTVAVGIVVGTIGQSNMSYWYDKGYPAGGVVDASAETFQLRGGEWSTVVGDAARTFANTLAASAGAPVALVDGSVGGTSLLEKYGGANGNWQSTAANGLYDRFLAKLEAVGGTAEIVLWVQGENDARAGATTGEYLDALNDLFARLRADVGPASILASKLGTTIYDDPQWSPLMSKAQADAVRLAQTMADAANDDVVFVGADDLSLQDQIHRTTVSSAIEAIRLIDAYLARAGVDPIHHETFGTDGDDVLAGSSGTDFVDAGGGDDTIGTGAGDDIVRGGDGADAIDGGEGTDLLSGGGGDDRIDGGDGNDRIAGDDGNDRIDAGAGDDIAAGGLGDDEIHGGDGDDLLEGGLGDDAVFGGAGNDTIKLGGGNDRIDAGDGDDLILVENFRNYNYSGPAYGASAVDGGAGYDVLRAYANNTVIALTGLSGIELVTAGGFAGVILSGSNAADRFDLRGTKLDGIGSIDMGGGDDVVFGTAADDRISGGAGADRLSGEGGDDVLIGGAGDDVVDGGDGTDLLQMIGRFSETTIDRATGRIGNAADGTDTVSNIEFVNFVDGVYDWVNDRFDPTPPFSGVLVNGTGGNDVINTTTTVAGQPKATPFNDRIYGFAGGDYLNGGGGADLMVGGAGGDTYSVDDPGDQVVEAAGEGTDIVYASVGYALPENVERLVLTGTAAIDGTGNALANIITGNGAANVIAGGGGNDTIDGGAGDDTLFGDGGNDKLDGDGGADTMAGGAGDDTYIVDDAGDIVVEAAGAGTDGVSASVSYALSANVERLTLTGTAAIDGTGNALANTLTGNAGSNTLTGGGGNDTIDGGAGTDTAAFSGRFADYAVNRSAGTVGSAAEGVDKLKNIEFLRFADGLYDWADGTFTRFNTPPTLTAGAQNSALVEASAAAAGSSSATIALQARDADPGDALEFVPSSGWTVLDATHWLRSGVYGTARFDLATATVTYDLDDARAATDALAGGAAVRDAFTLAVRDRSGATAEATVGFDIRGADDAAVLSSARVSLTEGNTPAALSASGRLTLTDVDSATSFVAGASAGAYGRFDVDASGAWTYIATSAHDGLAAGERHTERFAVVASDGTATTVEVEIVGANDAPTLRAGPQSEDLVEAAVATPGVAKAAIAFEPGDADAGDSARFDPTGWTAVDATHWSKAGLYGTATLDTATSVVSYLLDDDRAATDGLTGGARVFDTFVLTVRDRLGAATSASAAFAIVGTDDGVLVNGTGGNDVINPASSVGKQPKPTPFADKLYGFGGMDYLNGGGGADLMAGGAGNDVYSVDNAGDRVVELEDEGTDTVYASVDYALTDHVERLVLTGSAAIDGTGNALANFLTGNDAANTLVGGAGDDRLYGEGGADTLIGGRGSDLYYVDNSGDRVVELSAEGADEVRATVSYVLSDNVETLLLGGLDAIDGTGNALANTITGNDAANVLSGGAGADVLTGNGGADIFVFDAPLDAKSNIDRIRDFAVGEDRIALARSIFASLDGQGPKPADFGVGKLAVTAEQNIVYDSATGKLFYDADGAGGAAQIQFAALSAGLKLTADSFIIL